MEGCLGCAVIEKCLFSDFQKKGEIQLASGVAHQPKE